MRYSSNSKTVTIETTDLFFYAAVVFFKKKNQQQGFDVPIKKLTSFIEYLGRNDGSAEFLLSVAELILMQIEIRYGTDSEEHRLARVQLETIKVGYEAAKSVNEQHDTNRPRQKTAIFFVDKKDPYKTLDSLLALVKQETQRLTDLQWELSVSTKRQSLRSAPVPKISQQGEEAWPALIVESDSSEMTKNKGQNISHAPTHATKKPIDPNLPHNEQMRQKYGLERKHQRQKSEKLLKVPESTNKQQKYFSNTKILSLMRDATKAEYESKNIRSDMKSSEVLLTDSVAYAVYTMYDKILQEDETAARKGKLTYGDLSNLVSRHNDLLETKHIGSSVTSGISNILGGSSVVKTVGGFITNVAAAAHEGLDGKTRAEHRSDYNVWLERKTTTSRAIASLKQAAKEKSEELGPLGWLFSPMRFWRNSDAKSLVEKLREEQHQSRNLKNGFDKNEWEQTIDKYLRYVDQVCNENSAENSQADVAKEKISAGKVKLAKLNWNELTSPKKQNKFVNNINQIIDDIIDACAALQSAQSSHKFCR